MARKPTDKNETGNPSREDEILMREIDEAVRQDDAKEFFQKYGVTLGVALAVLIAGMFGYMWWQDRNEAEYEAHSETIISALDSVDAGDFEAASDKVDTLIDNGSPGARSVARYLQAATALEQGDTSRAVELYAAIHADEEAPQPLRDLALIREVSTNFDDREPADVIARLQPLAVPGGDYFGSAGELVAIAHLEAGDNQAAGTLFAEIARDETVPETLRARARRMSSLLGVDVIDDVDELMEGLATPTQGQVPAGAQ